MSLLTMPRRLLLVASLLVLAACNNCSAAKCQGGITFLVADVAGALARGSSEPLQVCFDGQCRSTTITRANAGGTVFLAFKGVGNAGDHTITIEGVGAMKGDYKGPIDSYKTSASCAGTCALATVKLGADGTVTPGHVAPPTTTLPTAATPTTTPTPATGG